MKSSLQPARTVALLPQFVAALISLGCATFGAHAADRTWNGGGNDDNWGTPGNWGGTAPSGGDSLFFGGNLRLSPSNNFPAGTIFSGLTINNPAGPFTLRGNSITLGGNIADNMPLVPQTINLGLILIAP